MPQVTIVVATRNRRSRLAETLPRHLRLPDAPEVIVVDNGSHDGTRQLVERTRGARLIALDRNRGTAARNVGGACARSPHLAFTDDDAWWEPGALAQAVALLDRHPRLAVIQPRVLVGRGRADDPTCRLMATSPLLPAPGQPGRAILSFLACAVIVRRSAFSEVGGFPGRFVVGGEEEIVGWDLETAGWQLSYVPEIVAHHDPPASGSRPVRRELEVRNRLWTVWLRAGRASALTETGRAFRAAARDTHAARGLVRSFAGAPWALAHRRPLPARVEARRLRLAARGS